MNKSILVTGGAGYIGSHAVLALLDQDEHVIILDDFSGGEPVADLSRATIVKGDVGDAVLVERLIREHDIDTVLHFAGFIRVDESVREPEKYFKNNTENTRILVETAQRCGVSNLIFSSSASVYGNPERVPVKEEDACKPINPYGESKLRAEKVILDSGMHAAILRYFNVAGVDPQGRAGYRIEEHPTHMIRSCIRAFLAHTTFTINGNTYPTPDGTCVRDYIHVSDLADAHVQALRYLRGNGPTRIFNCGEGHGHSNLEVVREVGRITGIELPHVFGPAREGDPAILVADSTRMHDELGWSPSYGLSGMIKDELAWVSHRI